MIKAKIFELFNPKALVLLLKYSENYRLKLLIIVFMHIFHSLSGVVIAVVTKNMIDSAVNNMLSAAFRYGITLAVLFLGNLFLTNYSNVYTTKLKESMKNKLQIDLLKSIFEKQWLALYKYKTGDIMTRINADVVYVIEIWISVIPNLIALALQLITAYIVLSRFDSTLALLAFIIAPITFIPGFVIGRRLKKLQKLIQQAESALNSFINESMHNFIVIRTFKAENKNLRLTAQYQNDRLGFVVKKNKTSAMANFILGLGYQTGFFAALAFGAYRLSTGVISFGTFTAFLQLVSQIQYPIDGLSRTIPQIIASFSSVERLQELYDLPEERSNAFISTNGKSKHIPKKISLEKIRFEYNENAPVLDGLTMEISQGEKVALLGSSGEGKTTLAMILLGLFTPQSGNITITMDDNVDVPITSATRNFFSYVPQNNALFSGSIEYNLRFAGNHFSELDLHTALTASCALKFVSELPSGLNTIVGENGIGLSEGQIQRLCIARALLRKSPFLILDEATSALDIETENSIIQGLMTYYPQTTIIAITHRSSILSICNRVFTLRDGKIKRGV